jgi:hypothetical protein
LNKIVSIKETSPIFLAIVLVLGTIALAFPSFSVEAQASSDHEKDYNDNDDDKKSYDKDDRDKSQKDSSSSVNIKKVKCNNINVNLNGLDVEIGVPNGNGPVNGAVAVAQETEEDDEESESNSIESNNDESDEDRDRQSDSNKNSKIVCINNNNNIVVGEELEPPTCEDCFTTVLNDEEKLDDLIQAFEEESGGFISSLNDLCDFITENVQIVGFREFISEELFIQGGNVGISEDKINEILDCLEEVFGEDFPREFNGEPLTAQQQQQMNWKSWNN